MTFKLSQYLVKEHLNVVSTINYFKGLAFSLPVVMDKITTKLSLFGVFHTVPSE